MEKDEPPYLVAYPLEEGNAGKIDSQMEVANSTAFQNLEEQYYAGTLTSTEMAMYKARFIKLHDALQRSRESEYNLHQLMKFCLSEVERQEIELGKAEQFPENAVTEPLQLRAQILTTYNSAMETEERVENLLYEEALLREERKLLKRDFSRLPTAELEALGEDIDIFAEMDRRVKTMQNQCQESWMEIDMIKMETKRSKEQVRTSKETLEDVHQEHNEMQIRLNRMKADWVLASALPGQYMKETEKARKYKSDYEKEINKLDIQYSNLIASKEKFEENLLNVIIDNGNCKQRAISGKQQAKHNKIKTEELSTSFQNWQDLEMVCRTEKAKLIQRGEACIQEKKELGQEQTKLKWEKDFALKTLKKSTMQLEVLTESVKIVQIVYEKTRARFAVAPKYDGTLLNRKNKLTELVRMLQIDIGEEGRRTASEKVHVNQAVLLSERRLSFLEHLRAESMELLRLASALTEDLAKSVCEFNASYKKFTRLSEDLRLKVKYIGDQTYQLEQLDLKLSDVSIMYTEVKMERNKCVSLLQAAMKVSSDTRERLKQQANESEILLTEAQKREFDLNMLRKNIFNLIAQRDHKRHDFCKMAAVVSIQNDKREMMRQALVRLNLMFNQAEASIIALKKSCERNARLRNERAILLIERNQEVYLLQEREKSQETAMASAKLDLRGLEDEHACSLLYLKQVQHFIHLVKEKVPKNQQLERSVRGLIQELIGIRAKKAHLVDWFEDPDRPGRLRLLGGIDPSQSELWIILGKLEKRLAMKEEDLSEKNLVYEAVCRLVDALRVRTDASKDDTLSMALQVNGIQAKLLKLKRRMETRYAELIITNAENDRLQKEVLRLEKNLDISTIRMMSGIPPNKEFDDEFNAKQRRTKVVTDYRIKKTLGPSPILPMIKPKRILKDANKVCESKMPEKMPRI